MNVLETSFVEKINRNKYLFILIIETFPDLVDLHLGIRYHALNISIRKYMLIDNQYGIENCIFQPLHYLLKKEIQLKKPPKN